MRQRPESGGERPNLVSEEVSQSARASVERLLNTLLPRVRGNLATPESAYEFVVSFVGAFGLDCDTQDDGIPVLNPSPKEPSDTADPLPKSDQPVATTEASNWYFSGFSLPDALLKRIYRDNALAAFARARQNIA